MKVTPENISRIAKQLFQQEGLTKEELESATKQISSGFDDAGVFSAAKMKPQEKLVRNTPEKFAGKPINDIRRFDDVVDRPLYDVGGLRPEQVENLNGPNFHAYQQAKRMNPRAGEDLYYKEEDNPIPDGVEFAELQKAFKDSNTYTPEQLAKSPDELRQAAGTEEYTPNEFLNTDKGKQALDYLFNTSAGKEYSDEALSNLEKGYERTGEYGLGMMSLPTKANGFMGMLGSNEFGAAVGGGVIGGAANMATGGDFESGFMAGGLAGGLGKSITKNIAGSADDLMRLEKGAIAKVLDENKSYDELLESRRDIYRQPEREIEALEKQRLNPSDEAARLNKEEASALEALEKEKSNYNNFADYNVGVNERLRADKEQLETHLQGEFNTRGLNEGSRPEKATQAEYEAELTKPIDFKGKRINLVRNSDDELVKQHTDEIDTYEKMIQAQNSGGPAVSAPVVNEHSLFKSLKDYKDTRGAHAMHVDAARAAKIPEFKKQDQIAWHKGSNVDLPDDMMQRRQEMYDQQMKYAQERRTTLENQQKPLSEAQSKVDSIRQQRSSSDKNIMETNNNLDQQIAEKQKALAGKPRLQGDELNEQLHKDMLKEASVKDLGEEAGFMQKRAQNFIKPGTRDSGKSTGIESRHMVLGGAALAGGIFGNRKRDHSRGFNSHRGSRI